MICINFKEWDDGGPGRTNSIYTLQSYHRNGVFCMVDVAVLTGIAVLVVVMLILVVIIAAGAMAASNGSKAKKAEANISKVSEQENLARLRHRDLDVWAKEVNIIRAKRGLRGIPRDVLARVQFNLKYSIDDSNEISKLAGSEGAGPGPRRLQ